MKNAFAVARSRPGGSNMGLESTEVWWQGYSGLSLRDVKSKLVMLKAVGDDPDILVLHCGGNDFGRTPLKQLRSCIDDIITFVAENFQAKLVWSEILPRNSWRYSNNHVAMEAMRQRFNSYAASRIISNGGFYIKHPDLRITSDAYYLPDGVHLTFIGNLLFLAQLSSALHAFQLGQTVCFR